jgi:hypothetical protein
MSGAHLPPGEAWRSGRMPARRRSTPKAPPDALYQPAGLLTRKLIGAARASMIRSPYRNRGQR